MRQANSDYMTIIPQSLDRGSYNLDYKGKSSGPVGDRTIVTGGSLCLNG